MASYVVADTTQPEQVWSYVDAALERHGGIDIFVATPGSKAKSIRFQTTRSTSSIASWP